MSTVHAGVLDVAVERHGNPGGWPVVLLHGFPYDVRCYDQVAPVVADAGANVVVPYLRGYGGTRFTDPATMRSGQQAALAHDLLDLIDALGLVARLSPDTTGAGALPAWYRRSGRRACPGW